MEGVFLENAADGMTKEELMELLWRTLKAVSYTHLDVYKRQAS